jgi:hypothetical protein
VSQRESVYYDGKFSVLLHNLRQLSSDATVETTATKSTTAAIDEMADVDVKMGKNGKKGEAAAAKKQPKPTHIVKIFKVSF